MKSLQSQYESLFPTDFSYDDYFLRPLEIKFLKALFILKEYEKNSS